jgi:hypothetical protein
MQFDVEAFDPTARTLTTLSVEAPDALAARRQVEAKGLEVRNLSEYKPPKPQHTRLALVGLVTAAGVVLAIALSESLAWDFRGKTLMYALPALVGLIGLIAVVFIGKRRPMCGVLAGVVILPGALCVASHALQTQFRNQQGVLGAQQPEFMAMIDPTVSGSSLDLLCLAAAAAMLPMAVTLIKPRV